jgi:pyruvate,water dikinase
MKIAEIISKTNVDDTKELEANAKRIRELIIEAEIPEEMEKEIIEGYELLSSEDSEEEMMNKSPNGKLLRDSGVFVAVRSSATTEDLATASFAGQQETFTNVRGSKNLLIAVRKCFASLYTARAVYYRHKQGFDKANALLSVVIQKMINSEKSGVMFTKNPSNGNDEIIIEAVFGLGEGIVSGKILPDHYVLSPDLELIEKKIANKKIALYKEDNGNGIETKLSEEKSKSPVLSLSEINTLGNLGQKIEKHYGKPQDIEFAVANNKVYIVQSRPVTTIDKTKVNKEIKTLGKVLLSGLSASPGVASGVVKIVYSMDDLDKVKQGDILVTKMTNPDMVVTMQRAVAVLTDEGGATSHAAIVSREMGIPCVVGTEKATTLLKDGMIISVDGTNGKVYEGKIEGEGKKEILPIVQTKTKIKVMVDLPDFASRAALSGCSAVGLVRLEGIIAESGKHPLGFLKADKIDDYSKVIEAGVGKIAEHFKEVWIRTSDIRSDEYRHLDGAPSEVEVNPMLGFHGIRFSLKNLPIFEAEIKAIKNIAEKYHDKKFGLMFPQVIAESEIVEAYRVFKKYQRGNMIIGAMIETPAAVQIIRSLCKYIKFISFGTNDLTQYTLAVDRGNSECQYLYDEMHPAVLSQIKRVIDICKEYHVETSICGQAGSKKEMVEQLVRFGIDSISVNADMARDISLFVQELESKGFKNKQDNQNNMAKSKILPVDNLEEVKEKVDEKKQELDKKKVDNKLEEMDSESKVEQEEFPEFEIGFDPFQQQ